MTNRNRQAQEREQLQVSRARREVHFEEQYPRGGNAQGQDQQEQGSPGGIAQGQDQQQQISDIGGNQGDAVSAG